MAATVHRPRTKRTRCQTGETFERFTDRSRRVLVLAQEEARLLNHSFIGTEHILLGLVSEREGVAAKVLESLGITLTAVRKEVRDSIGAVASVPTGSPPFTPRAKKVLELALREALQLGHSYIGTEHLLLGLVCEGEGVAAQVLQSLGADLQRVRREVIRLLGRSAVGGAEEPEVIVHALGVPRLEAGRAEELVPVGRRWSGEVVVAGRGPADFAAAHDQLAELAKKLGLDSLDASRLHISSVETADGPGLRLSVIHKLPPGDAGGQEDRSDAPRSGGPESTCLEDDPGECAHEGGEPGENS